MKQIFHIFRKDVRHHWMVILVCQAALVLYCWEEISSWSEPAEFGVYAFSGFIRMLPPLAWCFFILRMVQDESLVGDRQFWVTRPYEWKKLLAEKILLIVVFVNVPLLIAGAFLLARAGFSPAPHIPGLLGMQLFLFVVPLLPLQALATVTRTLAPAIVTLMAVLLFAIGFAILPLFMSGGGVFYSIGGVHISSGISSDIEGFLFLLFCVVAIVLQYARRKTLQSRLWLAGGVAAMVAISLISAWAARNRDPLPMPRRTTIAFHADLDPIRLVPPKAPAQENETVPIAIPIRAWGLPPNTVGEIRGIRIVLEGPGGLHWDARQSGVQLLGADDNHWRPAFAMEAESYQRLKNVQLKAHVSVGVDVFRDHDSETVVATGGEFAVPGLGRCRIWGRDRHALRCNSPLQRPLMVLLRIDPASSTCLLEDRDPLPPAYGLPYAWQRGRDSGPEGGITPVATSFFSFWYFNDRVNVCPGTPLNFSFPQFVENVRSDFEIANLNLDDYRQASFESGVMRAADGTKLGLPPAPR